MKRPFLSPNPYSVLPVEDTAIQMEASVKPEAKDKGKRSVSEGSRELNMQKSLFRKVQREFSIVSKMMDPKLVEIGCDKLFMDIIKLLQVNYR